MRALLVRSAPVTGEGPVTERTISEDEFLRDLAEVTPTGVVRFERALPGLTDERRRMAAKYDRNVLSVRPV